MPKRVQQKVNITLPDGTQKRVSVNAKNYMELAQKVTQRLAEAQNAQHITVDKVVEEWEAEHSKEVAYYTADCYKRPVADVIEHFKGTRLIDLSPLDISRFMQELAAKRYARQTIKLRLTVINQACDYAIIKGYINNNPCAAVKPPKTASVGKRELPAEEQINAIKKACSAEFGLFAYFLLYTGCRKGEALCLKYEDIDRTAKTITVNKTIVFEHAQPIIKNSTKTESGNRTVPLLDALDKVLPKKKHGYIFADADGNPLSKGAFDRKWEKYCEANKITLTPHQLRHAFATVCYDAGLDAKEAQHLLGHSKEEITRNIYTHISEQRRTSSADKLNVFLSS